MFISLQIYQLTKQFLDRKAMFKNLQPREVIKVHSDRSSELERELAESKKELADAYEQSAKHARSLFDYIENSKESERKYLATKEELDILENEKEKLHSRISMLNRSLDSKQEAFDTLTEEYKSLSTLYMSVETKLKEQCKEIYDAKEKAEKEAIERKHMENQIIKSASIINDLNEEILRLREANKLEKKRPRINSVPNVGKGKEEKESQSKSYSNSNSKLFDGISSVLDSSVCMGYYDKPPIKKHRILETAHSDPINDIVYNSQGSMLCTCSNDRTVKTWTTLTGTNCRTYTGSTKSVRCVEFSVDGKYIAAGSADKGIYQWDTKSGKLIQKLHGHNDKVTSLKYLDITSLISGSHDRKLQIWDLNKGCIINSLSSCGSRVNDICTTPLNMIVTANYDQSIRMFDPRSLQEIDKVTLHNDVVTSVCCSSDYTKILTSSKDGSLGIIDCRSMEQTHQFKTHEYSNRFDTNRACFSGTDKYAMVGSSSGKIFVWDTISGELESSTDRGVCPAITTLSSAASGFQMAAGTQDGSLVLWDQ